MQVVGTDHLLPALEIGLDLATEIGTPTPALRPGDKQSKRIGIEDLGPARSMLFERLLREALERRL